MAFSERLRDLLDNSNVSIKDLGAQLDLSPSALGNYIRGYREPDYDILVRIASYFGVTTDYLLEYECSISAAEQQQKLLSLWSQLSFNQKAMALEQIELIAKYQVVKQDKR